MTMRASRWGWTLGLASMGVFLTSLDVVVVATALPVPCFPTVAGAVVSSAPLEDAGMVFALLAPPRSRPPGLAVPGPAAAATASAVEAG
ncbi:hypothetical protein ACRYCC_39420 [Actinomadura scrupuli]|uniref:hypothetical protein n=1 Tax=Actinomadura scrupuli TaxID=559629 RepID=UPI003D98C9C1